MKLCDYCGRENEDEAVYCRECGTQEFTKPGIEVTEAAQPSEEPEPPESELVVSDVPTTCAWCGRQNPAGVLNCLARVSHVKYQLVAIFAVYHS
jgi:hypothetical protein